LAQTTLADIVENFRRKGKAVAYAFRRGYRVERWTYREMAEAACRFARELETREIQRGESVLIWGDNSPEWIAAFLGCILRGVVAIPMDRISSAEFARSVCRQVEPRLSVCAREFNGAVPGLPIIVMESLRDILRTHSAQPYLAPKLKSDDTVQIVFTSGTTANPKGVLISHGNVLANLVPLEAEIAKYRKYERFVHPLRFLNLLPLSHVFGQFLGIFVPQLLEATVVFHDSLNPSEIIRAIKRERVSVMIAVPRFLENLKDKVERDLNAAGKSQWFQDQFIRAEGKHFLKRWWRFRFVHRQFGWKFWAFISGGAALDPEIENFWGRLGYIVIQGYGLTETTSLVSVNHPFKLGKGSIGQVLPGREIKLAENGEILVRGGNIAAGYYQGKEIKPVMGEEGWFQTGDLGELDAEGNLYFKGRKKSVIVTPEGMNIYPEDLESALRRLPQVRDCVVFGFKHNGNAEPCAVLLMADRRVDAGSVIKQANESLVEFQRIRRWFVWSEDDFPRTSTYKPRISLIQESVQSRLLGQESVYVPNSILAKLIMQITGRGISDLSPGANLTTDLNLSSLDRVELLSALEDRLQVDLNESRFSAATTVADLERMLEQPAPARSDFKYPRWAQRTPVALLRILVYYILSWPATILMACPAVRGRENLKHQQGPLLFISNHITQVDVGFVLAALPHRYRCRLAVAMWGELLQEMREPGKEVGFLKRLYERLRYVLVVALFNVFPLPQRTGFRESFAFAGESVDREYSILVFPEGRRTQDGKLSHFQTGIGMLANNLNLPVIPIRIDGLFELKKRNQKTSRPGAIRVTIGSAVSFGPGTDPVDIAKALEERMASMSN
jgi:long-chain acyl-CoA synthetase